MLAEFNGVLLMLGIAIVIAVAMLGGHRLMGPRRRFDEKLEPFECGQEHIVSPHQRFSVKFYLVAMLFVLFDIEVVFMYPWAVQFRDLLHLGSTPLVSMAGFAGVLGLAYVYALKKGALNWKS